MKVPMFSVVVPIYNVEKYLRLCIESILAQKCQDWELILVDDGSPDNCPAICDQYAEKDKRIRVVHKANGGLVSARQSGVAIACGEYVACVDGDDWIDSDYLSLIMGAIKQYSPDVICCGATWSYADGRNVKKDNLLPSGFYDRERMKQSVFPYLIENKNGKYISPSLWAKAIKRKIYHHHQQQVDTCVNFGEDVACVKPCLYKAESIAFIESWSYHYRQNPTSMTNKRNVYAWDGPEIIGRHLEKQIPMDEFDFQEQVYRRITHMLFNVTVSQFNRKEKYGELISDIRKHLNSPYYKKTITHTSSEGNLKWKLAYLTLKHELWPVIWLFCKIR